jgi:hypothetical protein
LIRGIFPSIISSLLSQGAYEKSEYRIEGG